MATIQHHNNTNKRSDVLVLFDIDGTLTPARQAISEDMDNYLMSLKEKISVGLVGGSDLVKISEQMLPPSMRNLAGVDSIKTCVDRYDYVFAENGLVAYKGGELIGKKSLVNHLGEIKTQRFINTCLAYMSKLELPCKRGNFIEFRTGMINICPVGRSCSQSEREEFQAYDQEHKVREKFINYLKEVFSTTGDQPTDLVFAIGGQISIDAYPEGWDKRFCLDLIEKSYTKIYFFGDKTNPGGNDYEIFKDPRTIGYSVKDPADTLRQLKDTHF